MPCPTTRLRTPTPSRRGPSPSPTRGKHVTQKREQREQELSQEELEAQSGEELPDREAMSLINANLAIPVNAAVAANVLSDGSTAWADATQAPDIDQAT